MAFQSEKYYQLLQKIKEVCRSCHRDPQEVKILAATKYAAVQDIEAALATGIQLIGENKVQDAEKKFAELSKTAIFPEKHFIGHLQTNKAKKALELFDVIESVDSLKLLECLNELGGRLQKKVRIFLEVNIAEDKNKFGLSEKEVQYLLGELPSCSFIQTEGLMTIVHFTENPEKVRPYFKSMKKLFEEARKKIPSITVLSMGMSHDFEIAIEEGSTEIRIGSYLFD